MKTNFQSLFQIFSTSKRRYRPGRPPKRSPLGDALSSPSDSDRSHDTSRTATPTATRSPLMQSAQIGAVQNGAAAAGFASALANQLANHQQQQHNAQQQHHHHQQQQHHNHQTNNQKQQLFNGHKDFTSTLTALANSAINATNAQNQLSATQQTELPLDASLLASKLAQHQRLAALAHTHGNQSLNLNHLTQQHQQNQNQTTLASHTNHQNPLFASLAASLLSQQQQHQQAPQQAPNILNDGKFFSIYL